MSIEVQNLLYVFGLRRSGHHGVLKWLLAHYDHPRIHFNNIALNKPLRIKAHQTPKPDRKYPAIILNVEDVSPERIGRRIGDRHDDFCRIVGEPVNVHKLLVLRDPYNLLASRMRHPFFRGKARRRTQSIIDKWVAQAEEFLGITEHIPGVIRVSFNMWFASEPYRREISAQIGRPFTDENLNKVPSSGGGSSFTRIEYDGRAQEMHVLTRYRKYLEEPAMQQMIADPHVRELSERIFGDIL